LQGSGGFRLRLWIFPVRRVRVRRMPIAHIRSGL
jgi:hypothetical protein